MKKRFLIRLRKIKMSLKKNKEMMRKKNYKIRLTTRLINRQIIRIPRPRNQKEDIDLKKVRKC